MALIKNRLVVAAAALAAAFAVALFVLLPWNRSSAITISLPKQPSVLVGPPPQAAPLEYRELSESQALATNEAIPFAKIPLESATGFKIGSASFQPLAQRMALDCLTSAIYYEAGYEPVQGKRAVAQVVLNRVRHPAFPNSVCAVIYQGSQRKTGCQFSFTCDGSLARRPPQASWLQARAVAEAALDGSVEPAVGMATHYHANYVVPYWASSLDKVSVIGAHLFYQWHGSWGRRAAFTQLPQPDQTTSAATWIDYEFGSNDLITPQPILAPSAILADSEASLPNLRITSELGKVSPTLHADMNVGTLKADENRLSLRSDTAERVENARTVAE